MRKPRGNGGARTTKPKPGRPTTYSAVMAQKICTRLADGESLRQICINDDMPAKSSVFLWLIQYPEFSDHYARAREQQAATYADDIVDIADSEPDPKRARVRIDARKWHASKLAPKKYGDKLELAGDKENPLSIMIGVGDALDAKLDKLIGRRASET